MSDNFNDINDVTANSIKQNFKNITKNIGKKAGKLAKRAIVKGLKKAGKAIIKTIAKAIQALFNAIIQFLISAFPITVVIVLIIAFCAFVWFWNNEERRTSAEYNQDPQHTNITQNDNNGVRKAVALVESQALIDAYYKYMSCNSYIKLVSNKEYSFKNDTEDFAGLEDYYEKENNFYLSSHFILMADEELHEKNFFFPEQIIKPVFYNIDNGKVKTQKILNENDGSLTVTSNQYNNDKITQNNNKITGILDYGLGSVLKYEKAIKDKYINCQYTTKDVIKQEYSKFGQLLSCKIEKEALTEYDIENKNANHIAMKLEGKDVEIGKINFNSSELKPFINNTKKYPINIPLINSAATFSGNIEYK